MNQSPPTWTLDGPLLLAGAGKMGGAMLSGWLAGGLHARDVLVQEPNPSADFVSWCGQKGVSLAAEKTPAKSPSIMVMAVKPQAMADVFPSLAQRAAPHTIVLSIAAGTTIASFEQHLPPKAAVVRAMPNTPAAIGRGITVLCANAHVACAQRALCERLMRAVGDVGWVADESLMDAVTAVSGSGPAYVFLLAEALADAGVKAGLDPDLSMQLARATISGSGELMRQSRAPAATLRKNVTSPGGTTAAALEVLMANDGLAPLMDRAVAAAVARGKALSK